MLQLRLFLLFLLLLLELCIFLSRYIYLEKHLKMDYYSYFKKQIGLDIFFVSLIVNTRNHAIKSPSVSVPRSTYVSGFLRHIGVDTLSQCEKPARRCPRAPHLRQPPSPPGVPPDLLTLRAFFAFLSSQHILIVQRQLAVLEEELEEFRLALRQYMECACAQTGCLQSVLLVLALKNDSIVAVDSF